MPLTGTTRGHRSGGVARADDQAIHSMRKCRLGYGITEIGGRRPGGHHPPGLSDRDVAELGHGADRTVQRQQLVTGGRQEPHHHPDRVPKRHPASLSTWIDPRCTPRHIAGLEAVPGAVFLACSRGRTRPDRELHPWMWAEDRERRMKAGVPAGPGATAELPPVMALRNTASAKVSRLIDADSRGRASGDSMSIPCPACRPGCSGPGRRGTPWIHSENGPVRLQTRIQGGRMTSGQRSDDTQSAAPFDGMCGPPGFPVFYDSVRTCANAHRFELLDDTLNTCATDPRRRGIRISRLPRWLTTSRLLPRCRRSQAIPISGESGYSPDVSLMESMRLPALPMGLHPSITRTPASTPGRPPGQACHKGTNVSIARTRPAVVAGRHARTGANER